MLRHVFIVACVTLILLPFLWVVGMSLRPRTEAVRAGLLPSYLELGNYAAVVQRGSALSKNLLNSVLLTSGTVVLTTACAALAGYALAHVRTPLRALLVAVLVASLFIPTRVVGAIGIWQLHRSLGLIDITWALLPPYVALTLALGVLIMRAVFQGISGELVDAARLDGAGPLRTFWAILLPLARDGLALVAAVSFVAAWGEYLLAAQLINEQGRRTLPVVLAVGGAFARPPVAALWIVSVLPSIVVAIALQRWVLGGMGGGRWGSGRGDRA